MLRGVCQTRCARTPTRVHARPVLGTPGLLATPPAFSQGRALAEQHEVTVAVTQLEGPLPERQLGKRPAIGDTLPPDDGRVRLSAPGPAASRGRWLYFRLLASPNQAAGGRAEWRTSELARAADVELGRRSSEPAASIGLSALARSGLVARTYANPKAPWTYTDAGRAKARELGIVVL